MICRGCERDKPANQFYVDNSRPRGRVARCKECYAERQRIDQRRFPRVFSMYLENARRRGILFTLTRDETLAFWQLPCSYCGGSVETLGLDRTDNRLGYVAGNVVSCCTACNRMKSDLSVDGFLSRCAAVTAHSELSRPDR